MYLENVLIKQKVRSESAFLRDVDLAIRPRSRSEVLGKFLDKLFNRHPRPEIILLSGDFNVYFKGAKYIRL